ncbi:hypothetical protein JM18_008880 [Phytophthora kernoviae]|uniref:Uncharacterized protein n=2 Tax=Phytophthora kernoviae TaxID=325452 RepID=A0A921V4F1_9STRA|nr:hypothetical protein G195_010078 [Phytophthora kernoviae 00238/432]KAG2510576.1 hypothetical protein JM18_008880 [Phytophthora kernoviae]
MNLLDDLPTPGHDGDTGEDHALLPLHVSSPDLQDGGDDVGALTGEDGAEYDASQSQNQSHVTGSLRAARRRRKIGKGIQLILLRKYVQCAKQFNRLPDRLTTEQLLEQGYDEFYYQGGNLNEPRLSYAAFLKLEQVEIRALIDELDHVRHGQTRPTLEYDALGATTAGSEHLHAVAADASVPILSDSSSIIGDAGTDGGVSAGDLSTAETYSSVMSGTAAGNDDIVVSRSKLDLMLRVAQENLIAQKKILEEVRAMEQRVAGIH